MTTAKLILQKIRTKDLDAVFAAPQDASISEKQVRVTPTPRPPDPVAGDWYDERICEMIDDLADVQIMEYPEHVRNKARALFNEFSEAAAQGNDARFWRALIEWQETWKGGLH